MHLSAYIYFSPLAIRSGDTVALQTYNPAYWLGCNGQYCARAGCPSSDLTAINKCSFWEHCYGEVFEIYRKNKPGCLRVGDTVGLHYPQEKGSWLGCSGEKCAKSKCPGRPRLQYGFFHINNWRICFGEVFEIYAKGKHHGAYIYEYDKISLYYKHGGQWLDQGHHITMRRPCLGKQLPPPEYKYKSCSCETFMIWKKH